MDRAFNPQTAPNVAAALAHGRKLLAQQPRLAVEQARKILASVPGSADGYRLLGEALRRTGEDESAGVEKDAWTTDLFVKNLFDVRRQLSKSIQCNEAVCGDPGGDTLIGGRIYTVVSRPRTIGPRIGRKF